MKQDVLTFIQNWLEDCHEITDVTLDTEISILNIDSLDFIELISELETKYHVDLPIPIPMSVTIEKLIDYVIQSNNNRTSISNCTH